MGQWFSSSVRVSFKSCAASRVPVLFSASSSCALVLFSVCSGCVLNVLFSVCSRRMMLCPDSASSGEAKLVSVPAHS